VKNLLISSLFFLPVILLAQINWTKHTVSSNFNGACGVYAVDVNQDSLIDILGAAWDAGKISLWINCGGQPIAWQQQVIDSNFSGADYVRAVDVDSDNDLDVLGSAWTRNEIAWWENSGGNPIQWIKHSINTNFTWAHEVHAADIDNDGDIDIYGASASLHQIAWWENLGGYPIQWIKHTVDANFGGARSVCAAYINNDSLIDLVGAAYTANSIAWWRNNGDTTWTKYVIDNNFVGSHMVYTGDVDNDNDIDVLGAAYGASDITWWRNDGGNPIQWTSQTIDGSFNGALGVYAADFNGDNHIDVVGTADYLDDLAWWKNDGGNPINWTKQIIDPNFDGAWPVYAEDIDRDGDKDILSAAYGGDEIAWWENNGLGIEESNSVLARKQNLFPTIICGQIRLPANQKYCIYNIMGKRVDYMTSASGIYFIKVPGTGLQKVINFKR
jgi:hypothetical protein